MVFRRRRDVSDEAAEFGSELLAFLTTLASVVRNAAEWLSITGFDALAHGAGAASARAGDLASSSRSSAKRAKRKGKKALVKLALVAAFLWWLDRELSQP
jgi:hypothetical protein